VASILTIHSFRGGTGKSNTTANVAAVLASQGRRVGIVDADLQAPGLHILFGLSGGAIATSLNDVLWDGCPMETAALDVTPTGGAGGGRIFLIPSSIKPGEITQVLREAYDPQRLTDGLLRLVDELRLDILMIDTHPGLNEETLLALVLSNALLIVLRPDHQDYEGTGIAVEVACELAVPRVLLVVNNTPPDLDPAAIVATMEETYGCRVAAVLPHSDEMMRLGSDGLFVLRYPDHPLTAQYHAIAASLVAE